MNNNSAESAGKIAKLVARPRSYHSRSSSSGSTSSNLSGQRFLVARKIARKTRKGRSGSTSINSVPRGDRINKLLADPRESRGYVLAARRHRHTHRAKRAPKLSAQNSAEWKQAYQIINSAIKITDALSEGLPGSKPDEAKALIREYFEMFSKTGSGDKMRKFVMSDKFKTARFQTRGEYRDEIKAAVLKQIKPHPGNVKNYENI